MQRLMARYPRIRAFVAARFARGASFGLHLTVGVGIALIGLWVFARIAANVFHQQSLVQYDLWLLEQFESRTRPSVYMIAQALSAMASAPFMIGLGVATGSILALRRQWLLLKGWSIALVGGELLNLVLKDVFQRPRPLHSEILSSQSWSFPSGHAMESLIAYGMLVYLLTVLAPELGRRRLAIVAGCAALLILAIGWSRIYLGVHHFSDVVGGYAAATLWLSASISGIEVARRSQVLEANLDEGG